MTRPLVPNSLAITWRLALLLLGPVLVPLQACTDLSENPPSAITPANFYRNEAEVVSSLAGIYAQLRSTLDDYYNISEISTDEMIVPTRGSDWYDGGQWLELHHQTWSAISPVGNGFGNGAWVVAFTGISRANALLEALPGLTFASRDTIAAEVRTLRAFYYYLLMDLFGGVPIVTTTELK
ncbi:MAG TPA: RagB/SusD family nutrient uptake outer membrane protein, partial [Gemmatimonadales bacterium]|nr:RagB/SusD family nutrient uptake outer membrane protein [Gemmatimonadales bacterium]